MKIKKIILENFKGTKSAEYNVDGKSAVVSGSNGKGKTTIADAFYYLFAGRDYQLVKNPEIYPIDVEECQPKVTVTVDIDGTEHSLSKWQVRSVKEKNGITEVSTKNEFSINEVPKSATTFEEFLKEHGIDTDTLLQYSHPEVFVAQMESKKDRDNMRNTLFAMASRKTDLEIAQMSDDTKEVAELLKSYSMEEIKAMYSVQKKKAIENVESIPDQIVGLEKAKVVEDVAEYNLLKVALQKQIDELETQLSADNSKAIISKLNADKMEIENEIKKITMSANMDLEEKRQAINHDIAFNNQDKSICENNISNKEKRIEALKGQIATMQKKQDELHNSYDEIAKREFDHSKWKYDENSEICPNCGQTYPADRVEKIKEEFENRYQEAIKTFEDKKQLEMQSLVDMGNRNKEQKSQWEKELTECEEKLCELKDILSKVLESEKELSSKLAELPKSVDFSENKEIIDLQNRMAEIDKEIANTSTSDVDTSGIKDKIVELKNQISDCDKKIGSVANNVRIDEQIEALRVEQQTAEQKKADAEKILYQLDLVSRKKNTMLSDEINKHFSLVNFLFFDYQKNGEYKEVCVPMVNGKRLGQSMNTGLEIMAKLDIISGLQKFYGVEIPVFLDQAEKLDTTSMKDVCDRYSDLQIISLKVSDDDLKVEVV